MNDNVKLWVEALRSGQYAQTQGALNRPVASLMRPTGYCCLGVACEVYNQHNEPLKMQDSPTGVVSYETVYGMTTSFLPTKVRDWLGLNTDIGAYAHNQSLMYDNDNGMTFEQIANLIEFNPDGLFSEDK